MAKRSKRLTPIRQVRNATGMTQREFANYVGIGYDLYQSLELGRAKWTKESSDKVERATGAIGSSLNPKHSKEARSVLGEPYTSSSFEDWRGRGGVEILGGVGQCADRLGGWLRILLMGAQSKGRLLDVAQELGRLLTQVRLDFTLAKETDALLAKVKIPHTYRYTVGQLRKDKRLAERLGYRLKEYRNGRLVEDSEMVEIKRYYSPVWHPAVKLPSKP